MSRERIGVRVAQRVAEEIGAATDPTTFVERAAQVLVEEAGAFSAWGTVLGPDREFHAPTGVVRHGDRYVRFSLGPLLRVPDDRADLNQLPYRVDDLEADVTVLHQQVLLGIGARSLMRAPLEIDGETIGVLAVLSDRTAAFSDTDVTDLAALAQAVSARLRTLPWPTSQTTDPDRSPDPAAGTYRALVRVVASTSTDDVFAVVEDHARACLPGWTARVFRFTTDGFGFLPLFGGENVPSQGNTPDSFWHARWLVESGVRMVRATQVRDAEDAPVGVLLLLSRDPLAGEPPTEAVEALSFLAAATIDRVSQLAREQLRAVPESMTGLPGRPQLLEELARLEAALGDGASVGVLVAEIDHPMFLRQELGERGFLQFLRQAAVALSSAVPELASVFQAGSSQLAVLIGDASESEVEDLCRRVLERLRSPIEVGGRPVVVAFSIGAAVLEAPIDHFGPLRYAEQALIEAKDVGGNNWSLLRGGSSRPFDDSEMAAALHAAFGNGQLQVFYQPEMRLHRDGAQLVAAEALIRWEHPQRGWLKPDRFLMVVERAGMLNDLFAFVLDDSVRQVRKWCETLPDAWVGINVSPQQLLDMTVVELFRAAIDWHQIDPRCLCAEVTETEMLHDVPQIRRCLEAIRDLGVQIAIDDFGTGYSSLSHAKQLPAHWLKIGRGFVAGLGSVAADEAIVSASITMAHAMGLHTLAEGVETVEQHDILVEMGCGFAQGYLWSPAVDAETIAAMVAATHP